MKERSKFYDVTSISSIAVALVGFASQELPQLELPEPNPVLCISSLIGTETQYAVAWVNPEETPIEVQLNGITSGTQQTIHDQGTGSVAVYEPTIVHATIDEEQRFRITCGGKVFDVYVPRIDK